jgi:hypothetical protein
MEDINQVSNVRLPVKKQKTIKKKSSVSTYKSPLVNVYYDVYIHVDIFMNLSSMYPEKIQDGFKITMTFKDNTPIPIFVSQKELIKMYNKKKDDDSEEKTSEEICIRMIHKIMEHVKTKFKIYDKLSLLPSKKLVAKNTTMGMEQEKKVDEDDEMAFIFSDSESEQEDVAGDGEEKKNP